MHTIFVHPLTPDNEYLSRNLRKEETKDNNSTTFVQSLKCHIRCT